MILSFHKKDASASFFHKKISIVHNTTKKIARSENKRRQRKIIHNKNLNLMQFHLQAVQANL